MLLKVVFRAEVLDELLDLSYLNRADHVLKHLFLAQLAGGVGFELFFKVAPVGEPACAMVQAGARSPMRGGRGRDGMVWLSNHSVVLYAHVIASKLRRTQRALHEHVPASPCLLILKEEKKFLQNRIVTPAKIPRLEVLVVFQHSLTDVARAQQGLSLKVLRVVQVLAKVQILNERLHATLGVGMLECRRCRLVVEAAGRIRILIPLVMRQAAQATNIIEKLRRLVSRIGATPVSLLAPELIGPSLWLGSPWLGVVPPIPDVVDLEESLLVVIVARISGCATHHNRIALSCSSAPLSLLIGRAKHGRGPLTALARQFLILDHLICVETSPETTLEYPSTMGR